MWKRMNKLSWRICSSPMYGFCRRIVDFRCIPNTVCFYFCLCSPHSFLVTQLRRSNFAL